ncbi:MAG TPA: hypothetical protein VGV38_03605, partial [Pyrinomonadaceae bacterium]|nr:hypothetical protein [Pyrinomonadaceae bacterium]
MKQALAILLLTLVCVGLPRVTVTSPAANDSGPVLTPPPSGPASEGAVRFVALGDTGTGGATQYAV